MRSTSLTPALPPRTLSYHIRAGVKAPDARMRATRNPSKREEKRDRREDVKTERKMEKCREQRKGERGECGGHRDRGRSMWRTCWRSRSAITFFLTGIHPPLASFSHLFLRRATTLPLPLLLHATPPPHSPDSRRRRQNKTCLVMWRLHVCSLKNTESNPGIMSQTNIYTPTVARRKLYRSSGAFRDI